MTHKAGSSILSLKNQQILETFNKFHVSVPRFIEFISIIKSREPLVRTSSFLRHSYRQSQVFATFVWNYLLLQTKLLFAVKTET